MVIFHSEMLVYQRVYLVYFISLIYIPVVCRFDDGTCEAQRLPKAQGTYNVPISHQQYHMGKSQTHDYFLSFWQFLLIFTISI